MSTNSFKAHVPVLVDGTAMTLMRKVDAKTWQLEEQLTRRIHTYTIKELHDFYVNGSLIFQESTSFKSADSTQNEDRYLASVPPELFEKAKMRRAYVMAVEGIPLTRACMDPAIDETWKKLGAPTSRPNFSTVARWRRSFQNANRSIRHLVDQRHRKGNRTSRYPDRVVELVDEAIESKFMTTERKTIQDTLEYACLLMLRENKLRLGNDQLPMPTRRLVTSRIREIPAFDKHAARFGHQAAVKMFRSAQRNRITLMPLERAEIDHTRLDMMVINDETGLPMGRPWITACIDDFSRCILGIYITFASPSYLSVAKCLEHAFQPKTALKSDFPSVVNEWEAHGVMREIVVDNGLEFHSDGLENACLLLGTEIHYSARKTPWFKGKIERFLGTLNRGAAHGNPGTTFSDIFEKGDYEPGKHAVIRLHRLKEVVNLWIADYYHQKPHRVLGQAPKDAWASNIAPEDIYLPEDPLLMEAMVSKSDTRVLTHKGIEYNSLFYNAPDLANLRRKHGDKFEVEIRYNPEDIGHIMVVSPDKKKLFKVPAVNFDYAKGMNEWQHQFLKQYAAARLKKYDSQGWLEAKEKISLIFAAESAHTKKLRRKNTTKGSKAAAAPTTDDKPAPTATKPVRHSKPSPPAPSATAASNPSSTNAVPTKAVKRFAPIFQPRGTQPDHNHKDIQL